MAMAVMVDSTAIVARAGPGLPRYRELALLAREFSSENHAHTCARAAGAPGTGTILWPWHTGTCT